jgi:type VI secretion system protein ImpG
VTVRFDPEKYSAGGFYLFAAVLDRFLSLYCTINSFTRLVTVTGGRGGELHRWAPRLGEKILM